MTERQEIICRLISQEIQQAKRKCENPTQNDYFYWAGYRDGLDKAHSLAQYAKGIDRDMLDEIVDLLVETVCSARKTIRIAGDDYPAELVKSKLMKLNSSHIEFVFDCISKNTTEIRNIKKYLLAVLFNAPSTINGYYTALVAHDMNTGKI